jgi:hypothetical protein
LQASIGNGLPICQVLPNSLFGGADDASETIHDNARSVLRTQLCPILIRILVPSQAGEVHIVNMHHLEGLEGLNDKNF